MIISSSAINCIYTVATSVVTAITCIVSDPSGENITLLAALSGALFFLMWMWLGFDVGALKHTVSMITIAVYWIVFPIIIFAVDFVGGTHSTIVPLRIIYNILGALLFSGNYLVSWLCNLIGIGMLWGTLITAIAIARVIYLGKKSHNQRF